MQSLLLDINEVAAALGIGRRTAYALRARGDFPKPATLGARVVKYRTADVLAFVDSLATDTVPTPEPERLKAGRDRRRGSTGGSAGRLRGGSEITYTAKPRRTRPSAEGSGIEPLPGANSNPSEAARK